MDGKVVQIYNDQAYDVVGKSNTGQSLVRQQAYYNQTSSIGT